MQKGKKYLKHGLLGLAFLSAFLLSSGCGTFIHPERRGQEVTPEHELDVGIAVLDGVGLLFFVIPGLIAYIVDFSNGSIYVPPSGMDTLGHGNTYNILKEEDDQRKKKKKGYSSR